MATTKKKNDSVPKHTGKKLSIVEALYMIKYLKERCSYQFDGTSDDIIDTITEFQEAYEYAQEEHK